MNCLRQLFGFIFILTLASALPLEDLKSVGVVKDVEYFDHQVPISSRSEIVGVPDKEESTYVAKRFSLSNGVVSRADSYCQGLCETTLHFNMVLNGAASSFLEKTDRKFQSALTSSQKEIYANSKRNYGGGLRIPFMRVLGFNLGARYTKQNVDNAREHIENYDELANAARSILSSFQNATVRIKGTVRIRSYSQIPSRGYVSIKFARVTLLDSSVLNVFSSLGEDLGTGRGTLENLSGAGAQQETYQNEFVSSSNGTIAAA
ncbi:hypothetical protein BWQ96_07449 [Gracilariopsis chorda]|uniref:Uncharacterized protein n=1 Tax=Gracilariopsis chorda TaxID=448386 RepID=A0A2V3IL71_9FLOR|nr:hypothetical protein BWQ96_10918 [Gracilariopsis chorda]PXF42798.1 hypothetical protein BWQ96_07449 [Gracilariopsis chorda]|eukprot:PXF39398.1 hypothetical protein BWQ96_10918 [Gracilariopsis chorda]